jgi:apolipoprotein N-acyltransferase
MTVDLLQGNISQGEKFNFDTGVPQALAWYKQALLQSQADLVITPETAIPALPLDLPTGYWLGLQQHFAQAGRAALVGLPLGSEEDGYTNSVVGLKPSGSATHYAYFKQHLVPFGEFIPPLFRWFTNLMSIPLGDFSRGDVVQPSFAWGQERFAPNICYEDLFGEELAARFVQPSSAPTVLVNVSNLAWFGDGAVLDQHRHIARMRSLELDRPSLRATNTGVTALIDRHGRVLAELPRATQGVLRVQVRGNEGSTFFTRWAGKYGQLPLWAVAFALIFLGWLRRPGH